MSFRTNNYQQISLMDSFSGLTSREQKALENSWAKVFAEDIFPSINEEPFRVLYSDAASRCHASNYSSHLRQLYRRLNPTSHSYHLS